MSLLIFPAFLKLFLAIMTTSRKYKGGILTNQAVTSRAGVGELTCFLGELDLAESWEKEEKRK